MSEDKKGYTKSGRICGQKMKYPDGVGYTIWTVMKKAEDNEKEDDGCGPCWDYSEEDAEDVKKVVDTLLTQQPEIYEPDEEYEAHVKHTEEKQKKLWYRLYSKLKDIGMHFTPFDWRFRTLWVSRPIPHGKGKNTHKVYILCSGFYLGPICVTWPR